MRLVDRDQGQRHLRDQAAEALAGGALGRDVEKVELAALEPVDRLGAIIVGRGQSGGADAEFRGGADLVVHQRDQGRDDQGRPLARQRRHLVAERLARSGRHHRQRMAAGHDAIDHFGLDAAEILKAECVAENLEGLHGQP